MTAPTKVTATAQVQVTLQFSIDARWDAEMPMAQVYAQARERALYLLREGVTVGSKGNEWTAEIVGPIHVRAMLMGDP